MIDEDAVRARLDELISAWVHIEYQSGDWAVVWSSQADEREAEELAEKLEGMEVR